MLKLSGEVSDVDCEKFSKSGSGEFANVGCEKLSNCCSPSVESVVSGSVCWVVDRKLYAREWFFSISHQL